MCYLCVELIKKFDRAIQQAGVEASPSYLSQLFEKRAWFFHSDEDQQHKIAKFFESEDDIDEDSMILDGKRWDEALEIKFKQLDKSLYPAHELNPTTEAIPVVEAKTEPVCAHDWREYVGLGLSPPEIICCNCGKTKATSK